MKIINKKEIELGRWRIIRVKIINKKEIELKRSLIRVKIINIELVRIIENY